MIAWRQSIAWGCAGLHYRHLSPLSGYRHRNLSGQVVLITLLPFALTHLASNRMNFAYAHCRFSNPCTRPHTHVHTHIPQVHMRASVQMVGYDAVTEIS